MKVENKIYETEHFILRHAEFSKNIAGYLYIEPKRHIENFSEFTTIEFKEIGEFLEKGIHWIYKHLSPKKIYTVTISEAVPHIHFHLVPRYKDEEKGFSYLQKAVSGEYKIDLLQEKQFEEIKRIFLLNEKNEII